MASAVVQLVVSAVAALREQLAALESTTLSANDCAALVGELATAEKACAAAKVRVVARGAEDGAHRIGGFADARDWLARTSGSTLGEARAALATASGLHSCPDTREALAAGALSMRQAEEIARTEAERPGSEAELLDVARSSSLRTLRDRARRRRHEAIDPSALHARRREARCHRWWVNDLGNVAYNGELPPEVGIPIMNRLDRVADRLRRDAKQVSKHGGPPVERREAYAADALATLSSGGDGTRPGRADLTLVVDLDAYRRGHAHPGERCHIIGSGPVPVEVARAMADDAFLKVVVHDGVRIHTVKHFKRHLDAELRTALELGPAPAFEGLTCVEAGCERRYGLEIDHVDPVANRGPTSFDNLEPRCWPHHRAKTERDRRAGLLGRNAARRPAYASPGDDPP